MAAARRCSTAAPRSRLPRPRHPGLRALGSSSGWRASTGSSSPRTPWRRCRDEAAPERARHPGLPASTTSASSPSAAAARTMLDWWAERLQRDCDRRPRDAGLFTDQRWIDFVPGMFDAHICCGTPATTSPTGTSHARADSRAATAGATVDGAPLRFFHFSGYRPRVALAAEQVPATGRACCSASSRRCAELCAGYARRSCSPRAIDASAWHAVPVRSTSPRRPRSTARMRRTYRDGLIAADEGGPPLPPAPFAGATPRVVDWLARAGAAAATR